MNTIEEMTARLLDTETRIRSLEAQTAPLRFDGAGAPGVGDDENDGYSVGSLWYDVANDKAYVCLDQTEGAAVWAEITNTGFDLNGAEDGLVLDADGDTTISAPTDDQIDFEAGNADRMTLTAAGLALASGARLNEFSIDGTLGGNSDAAAPTEKAVRTYVDGRIVVLATHATSTSWDGDAKAGASGTIDLSAVFGLPAGIRGIFARMRAVDETVNVSFQLKATVAGNGSIIGTTVLANQSAFAAGFCPCDANGDAYFLQSDELDGVYIEVTGYLL